jgi:hypothetical protein
MAKHIVKCLYCGELFDTSTTDFVKPKSNRYAHASCASGVENKKTQDDKDKENLELYIKELFHIPALTPKIKKQLTTFTKENGYTYSGIYKTLKYFFDVRKNPVEKANGGLGIVPYVYEEAFLYWRAIWEAQQQNSSINVDEYILPAREVHIESPKREPMGRRRKLFTFLNEEGDANEQD